MSFIHPLTHASKASRPLGTPCGRFSQRGELDTATPNTAATLPEPTSAEKLAIAEARERRGARYPRVNLSLKVDAQAGCSIGQPHRDGVGWGQRLENALGTRS